MIIKYYFRKFYEYYYGYEKTMFSGLGNINFLKSKSEKTSYRINLVIPNLCKDKYFGGVATAIRFSQSLSIELKAQFRIVAEEILNLQGLKNFDNYVLEYADDESEEMLSICKYRNLHKKEITIRENDVFIFTYWTTTYNYSQLQEASKSYFGYANKSIILIQDFEPSFYKWSTFYLLAESTYKNPNTIAVYNTEGLMKYINNLGYNCFDKQYFFEPKLNSYMREYLRDRQVEQREKVVLIYGRPRNARNCFSLIIQSLKEVTEKYEESKNWQFISIGVKHKNIRLNKNSSIESRGKLSLNDYCEIMSKSRIGISLMCSPHPSYPPLEMASFGMLTITNGFACKDLSEFSSNLRIIDKVTIDSLADAIIDAMKSEFHNEKQKILKRMQHFISEEESEFDSILHPIVSDIQGKYE